LKIEAGQYICLWLPISSPGFWNFWGIFQSHPFVIISWSEREQSSLELLIEPRGGMTRKLLNCSEDHKGGLNCLALFTGPHGISVPVEEYETVVLVASGFGIAAQLPYLKRLIHGYNACKSLTRRIHMVWQLKTKG
jgi:NAD(P)H-flavin reductase